ncbi:MAG: hypothetical protein AABY00_02740 [Nanoarchaeota archaeon]
MQKAFNKMKQFLSLLPLATALFYTQPVKAAEITIPLRNQVSTQKTQVGNLPLEQRIIQQMPQEEKAASQALSTSYNIVEENGKLYALAERNGQEFFKREVKPEVADTIKRLRQPSTFISSNFWDVEYVFDPKIQATDHDLLIKLNGKAPTQFKHTPATLAQAKETLVKAGPNAKSFLQAINSLSHEKEGADLVHAGIFYLANMKSHGYDLRTPQGMNHIPDTATFTVKGFYENALYAHRAWKEFSWGREVPREEFLQTLLPARATQEPLPQTRRLIYEALKPTASKLKTAEEALRFVNQISFATVKYEPTAFEDRSSQLRFLSCGGRCEDQTDQMVELGTAIGLPVVSVSVPWWGNANDNHVWAGVQTPERTLSVNSGDPAREERLDFNYNSSAPKVFIHSAFSARKDATPKFTTTTDLTVPASNLEGKAGLFVFNYGSPREVDSAESQNGKISFKNVGNNNILYIVGRAQNGKVEQLTDPFLVTPKGPTTFYSTHPHQAKNHGMYRVTGEDIKQPLEPTGHVIAAWYDGKYIPMNPGNPLPARGEEGKRYLENVHLAPNVIYHIFRVENNQGAPHGRPFVIENGKVVAH